MTKYLTTILFILVLGFAGGYSIATLKTRAEVTRSANELEGMMVQGVLFNDSRVFASLATHLHERGPLKDDPYSVTLLQLALQGISDLDKVNQAFLDRGEFAPVMFEDSREAVEAALEQLKTYPAQPFKEDVEQDGAGQPATRPESKSEGGDKPQPESEARSR